LNSIEDSFFNDQIAHPVTIRQELDLDPSVNIILFVGRLVKSKGIDTLIEAVGPILEESNSVLLYVGRECPPEGFYPDEEGLLDRMREQIELASWRDRVRILGLRDDVQKIMVSANMLVHPARIEGFGLVLAEAMALGLPVIASNVDGIPEVLSGSKSVLIDPDNSVRLRNVIIDLLNWSTEKKQDVITCGKKRAEFFKVHRRTKAYLNLFNEIIIDKKNQHYL